MDFRQSVLSGVKNEPLRQWLASQIDAHPPIPGQTKQQWYDWRIKVARGMSEQDALVSVQNGADSARAVQQQQQGPGIAYTHNTGINPTMIMPGGASAAGSRLDGGSMMMSMDSGVASASPMQNGGSLSAWAPAANGSFEQMPMAVQSQMYGQEQYTSYGINNGGYSTGANGDFGASTNMLLSQQSGPQHFGSGYAPYLSSPERQKQDLSAVLRGPEARAFSAQAAQVAGMSGSTGQGQSGMGGNGYEYPTMQNATGGYGGNVNATLGVVAAGGGVQMNDIAPRPTSGSPSALFGRPAVGSASTSATLAPGSIHAPIDVDSADMDVDGDGDEDVDMDQDNDGNDDDEDAEGEDDEEADEGGSEDAEGETDASGSRGPSRNASAEPDNRGVAQVKREREGIAMDVDDDALNVVDQNEPDRKPTTAQLAGPGFASTHWTFTYPTSGINVNPAESKPNAGIDVGTGAVTSSVSAGVNARWDPFVRLPVRRPAQLPLQVGPKSFRRPIPSYSTSVYATDFDLDRLALIKTDGNDVKPTIHDDNNAVAGPSKLSSPSKDVKPLITSTPTSTPGKPKPKGLRDSSSISSPSAPPPRYPAPSARHIASPHVRPPKPKEAITMSYLRQYLNPLHLKTAKPGPLWLNFRLRGRDRDEPPLYEPTPADVREIMLAMNKTTYDYKKALADNYDYSEVLGRWLGYMKAGLKEWEGAVGPTINFLAETDMPVNYIKHLKIAARIKSIKKMAEQQDLGLDPMTKKAIAATFANYASWLKSRIEPGNRTLPIPDYGLDSSDEEDTKAVKAKGSVGAKKAEADGLKKRKLSETIPGRVSSPSAGPGSIAAAGRGPSHSPALPATTSTVSPVKPAISSSFVPRTTPSNRLSIPPPKPSPAPSDPITKRLKPNPTASSSVPSSAYFPRATPAVPVPNARASLLAATLAEPSLGAAGPASSSTPGGASLPKSAAQGLNRINSTGTGASSNAQLQSNFINLAEPVKKPNKKGHVVRWKSDAELERVREFRQEMWEIEQWRDADDLHGVSSHQLDINEGMTLKREMFENCEEAEDIDWYNPDLLEGAPDLPPPTPEVHTQEQRERAILASPGNANADEKDVRIIAGRASLVIQPMTPSPDPVFSDAPPGAGAGAVGAPAASMAGQVTVGLAGSQDIAALLSSLSPALLPGLQQQQQQQQGALGGQAANILTQLQSGYGTHQTQNQSYGGAGGNNYGYGHQHQQQHQQQSADPWGPQTYGQPMAYGSTGNQYSNQHQHQQQQQQYPYQQQTRPGYEPQDNYGRSYGNNDPWKSGNGQGQGQGGGWGGQGGGGGNNRFGGNQNQNQNQNQQGRNGQARQGKKVCDFYARGSCKKGDKCDYRHV